jgi:uncharacterized LabA/DUF88 family protein
MPRYHAQAFVDGAYLRERADELKRPWVEPRMLVERVAYDAGVQRWSQPPARWEVQIGLARITYYDCAPAEGEADPPDVRGYCRAIERLPDTELGFGMLRGKIRRQKRVDTQIAVDMVVGAFTGTLTVAILVSGDEDHIPAIQEIKRRGVMVVVVGASKLRGLSPELVRAADRFIDLDLSNIRSFPSLSDGETTWPHAPHP